MEARLWLFLTVLQVPATKLEKKYCSPAASGQWCTDVSSLLTGWNAPASLTRSAGSHSAYRLQRDTRSRCCPHCSPSQMLSLIFSGGIPIIWVPEFPRLSVGPANKALIGIINISEEALPIPGNIPPRAPQQGEKKGWDGVSFCRRARKDKMRLFATAWL